MVNLRCMTKDDLPQINLVLSKSFTHANIKSGDTSSRTPLCRIDFLEMYLAANPGNSFVIEKDRKVIAYCFTHLWGSVGWIGPLSVLPSEQGQGYGKQIVCAAIETLKANGTYGIRVKSLSSITGEFALALSESESEAFLVFIAWQIISAVKLPLMSVAWN